MDPPPHKKKQPPPKKPYVVFPGEGWGELGDGAPGRKLSRRHAITRAIMALLLLAKREPAREP